MDITTGITFVQRGSRFEDHRSGLLNKENNRQIKLDYIEIPLLLTFKILQKNGKGGRVDLGGSFARLFNSEIKEVVTPFTEVIAYGSLQEHFKSDEFNFIVGASYFFHRRIGLGLSLIHI